MEEINLIVEDACLLVGLLFYRRLAPSYLRWIVFILLITAINENFIVPYVHIKPYYNKNNSYNIFSLIDMAVWLWIFYKILGTRSTTTWFLLVSIMLFAYSLIELCIWKNWGTFHTNSFRVYDLCIIIFSCSYLYRLLKQDYYEVFPDPLFWVCCACILYHSLLFLNLTTMAVWGYWLFKKAAATFYFLSNIGNILYYCLLSMAFVSCIYFKQEPDKAFYRK